MSTKSLLALTAILSPVVTLTAYAEVYMTSEEATKIFFPKELFKKEDVVLTKEEAQAIEQSSDQKVRNKNLSLWKSKEGSVVFVDQVLGKHEYITYAVGINKDGTVKGIEILEYRETHGKQVREPQWRQQFVGKDRTAPLKLDKDIKNISGATLSSSHVTGGVRRLIQTYEKIKSRL